MWWTRDVYGRRPGEELGNVVTHGVGAVVALVATFLLVAEPARNQDLLRAVCFAVYGGSLVLTLGSSALYHASRTKEARRALQLVDYASIYTLIAGSYTPFALLGLGGTLGWVGCGLMWVMATIGVVSRVMTEEHGSGLGTALYMAMGWSGVVAIKPLSEALPVEGLVWIFAGALFYSFGALLFVWERLPYNHLLWHFAVLGGAGCHFVCVLRFLT